MTQVKTPIVGIAGWKNSGKTTLVVRLIENLTRRGLRVATVKHAHHEFQIDDVETDSARHRRAGAAQVAIVSSKRWAVVSELRDVPEPDLDAILARLDPADIFLVEGYKASSIPKIEVRRREAKKQEPLAPGDKTVIAIVADHDVDGAGLPVFGLDDVDGIAHFILSGRAAFGASVTE